MTEKRPTRPVQRKTGETRRKPVPKAAEHIFEVLPDLIFRLDADGTFLEFMGGKQEELFREPKQFIGKPLGKVLPPEVADFLIPRIQRVLKSGKPASVDYLLPMKEGPRRFEARLVPSGDNAVLALVRSITRDQPNETALREIEGRYHGLVELSPSAIAVHDGRTILYVNRAAAALLAGGERDRIVGRPVADFVHPDSRSAVAQRIRNMLASRRSMPLSEERFARVDGTPVEVEATASSYQEGNRTLIQVIFRDISQRKADEQAIVRLNRLNAFLSATNQAIVRVAGRDELFQQICRIAVEKGGMQAAWMGLLDKDGQRVRPVASFGETAGYPEAVRISKGRGPEGKGATGRALRDGKVAICNDIERDPAMAPWREEALRRGFRSSAAVPVRFRARTIGALNLYASWTHAFGDQELEVLGALAADLEFALGALDQNQMRLEAETALVESEENFRSLFENSKDGIYIALADGRILSCNAAALRMFGYSLQELESVRTDQLYADPADRERFREAIEREGAVQNFEMKLLRKDRTVLDCLISASLHRGPGGQFLGYQGIIHDITERRRMEEALRSSEQRYRSIFEEGPLGMMITGLDGRFIQLNARFCEMLGYDESELIGRAFVDLTHPDHAPGDAAAIGRLVRGEIPIYKTEKRYLRKDGQALWVSLTVALIRDRRGEPLFFHSMVEDVSERKRSEEALRRSEEHFRDIVEHSTNMFYTHTPDHVLTYVSPQSRAILDCEPGEAMVRWTEFVTDHPVNAAGFEATQRAIDTGVPQPTYELQLKTRKGRITWVEVREAPVVRDGRTVSIVGALADITVRRAAEAALQENEQQLRVLSENLADGMVYQMNTGPRGLDRRFTYLSPAVERFHGMPVEAALRDPSLIYRQVVGADLARLQEAEADAIVNRTTMNIDVLVRLPSGEDRWRRFISTPRTIPNGDLVWDGIELDITESKQAGVALRESEGKYRTLVESARDAIFLADAETGFIFEVNRQAEKLTGLPAAELIGRHQSLLHPPEERDRYRRIFAEHSEGGNLLARDLLVRRADGTDVPVDISASVVEIGGRKVIQGVFQDISDRKWAEKALQESLDMLQRGMQGTILAMVTMVEMRDPFTAGHQSRVARLACAIGRAMGLNEHQVEGIRVAGLLHDIGKIGVPAEILSKPGRILDFEFNIIKSHSEIGHKILKEIDFPWPIATMVLHHHERLDGSGYPEGLKGGNILLESRILVVADVVEAMASHRPYRPARGVDLALGEVELNKGILYDPDVVDACLVLFRDHHFTLD